MPPETRNPATAGAAQDVIHDIGSVSYTHL